MGLARLARRAAGGSRAAPVFVGLALLFAFISRTSTPTHRLDDPQLRAAAARARAKRARRPRPGRRRGRARRRRRCRTRRRWASARAAASCSGTRSSTGASRRREVTVVIAHELGHLARNHIWKDVGWYALFAFPGTFLIARRHAPARRHGASRRRCRSSLLVLVVLEPARAAARRTRSHATWRPRPTGWRSRRRAIRRRRRRSSGASCRRRSTSRTRRRATTSCSRTIRRSCSASRWRRPGARYATSAAQSP